MTVSELIAKLLETVEPDKLVVIRDADEGSLLNIEAINEDENFVEIYGSYTDRYRD